MNIKFKRLTPFKRCVLQNFPFIEADFDALTNYGLLCKVVEYLNKVIKSQDEVQAVTEQMVTAFNNLYDYVNNYFDNLDVQEEINNKLDEMAESGELRDIILNYLNDKIKVIFPNYGKDGDDTLGDCTIIKAGDKAVMVDCFTNDATCYSAINEALYQNGISKIDYMIISHYHGDHIGNIARLISSGYLDDATVYLPRAVVVDGVTWNGLSVKTMLETAGITWVEIDNQMIEIDNLTIKLINGSQADYDYYQNMVGVTPNYNNYSVYCDISFLDKRILLTGDGEYYSNEYVNKTYLTKNGYDILKDGHHGYVTFNADFSKKVNPKYVVIPASTGMINRNTNKFGSQTSYWKLITPFTYVTGTQKEAVVFEVGQSVQLVSNSYSDQGISNRGTFNYYVDGSTTKEYRNGSQEFPFKTLGEASYLMPKDSTLEIKLNVINLSSEAFETYFTGYKRLTIDFNDVEQDYELHFNFVDSLKLQDVKSAATLFIEDCNEVTVENYQDTTTNSNPLRIYRCGNVMLNGAFESTGSRSSGNIIQASNCNFKMYFNSFTATLSGTARLFNIWTSNIDFRNDTVTALSSYPFITRIMSMGDAKQCSFSKNVKTLLTLFDSGSSYAYTTAETSESLSNYSSYIVQYRTNVGRQGEITLKTSGTPSISCASGISTDDGFNMMTANVSYTGTTVNISHNTEVVVKSDGTVTSSTGNKIAIVKIIGVIE